MSGTASNDAIDASHDEGRLKVYFDGGCPLCRSEIAHYRKLDAAGRVDFVDLSSPAADTGPPRSGAPLPAAAAPQHRSASY